ncbi:serine protease AprX [Mobilisporobacter senegalensis]|uniref:Serine protease AprX n=1 Tax=Mobilisporobacter senegalensis TaxID=1329262 RepID=A0A3N1XUZ4_9FIRM|nr:S8 family peptidase [Mobilisporobacter senegalensis]ROR30433.1 serine protease AprX [Mobilisporobacter senegalensis]
MNRTREIVEVQWAHSRRIFGEGIGVAVVDTGVSGHIDLVGNGNRIIAFKDFINGRERIYDDNGHGTHVSGIIGGDGTASRGYYMGIAPRCNIIGVKVLNYKGNGNVPDVLKGLQWIIENKEKYNIRVVNISVGATVEKNVDENSRLVQGVNAVWDSGIIVVVAAGNNGPKPKSISLPGISRKVITVGASDDNIAVELLGSTTMNYSGRGPTNACIRKPDIVAPGSNIVSCNLVRNQPSKESLLQRPERFTNMYTTKSGTSMATPIVSGAIALLLSAYPEMTNKEVKVKLRNSATDLGFPWSKQGWGLLNIRKLLS